MGMVGGYDAHFYCDSCNDFWQVNGIGIETAANARKHIREEGWHLRKDGKCICPECLKKPDLVLLEETKREGGDWQDCK